jgi:hypothetical protein
VFRLVGTGELLMDTDDPISILDLLPEMVNQFGMSNQVIIFFNAFGAAR